MKRCRKDSHLLKTRKLRFFGHVTRVYCMSKTFVLGTVQDRRKQGRPGMKWKDKVQHGEALLKAEDCKELRKVDGEQSLEVKNSPKDIQ